MSTLRLADRVLGEEEKFSLAQLGAHLDVLLNGLGHHRAVGFALVIFPYGSRDGECSFVSNGEDGRGELAILEAQLARLKVKLNPRTGRA